MAQRARIGVNRRPPFSVIDWPITVLHVCVCSDTSSEESASVVNRVVVRT